MLEAGNDRKKLTEKLERGERIIKLAASINGAYVSHLKKHRIRHFKDGDRLIVEITKDYQSFEGMVGIYETHFTLEKNEVFGRNLLKNIPKDLTVSTTLALEVPDALHRKGFICGCGAELKELRYEDHGYVSFPHITDEHTTPERKFFCPECGAEIDYEDLVKAGAVE